MRFVSSVSDSVQLREAAGRVCQQILEQLGQDPCHLACVFVSPIYRAHWVEALRLIHEQLKPTVLIGCSGSGVIGGHREYEWVPALSVVAAHLPGVRLFPFTMTSQELEWSSAGGFWIDKIGAMPDTHPVFLTLIDPYTCDPSKLLAELNATYPNRPITGGLASGGNGPGEHLLFHGADIIHEGAVGVGMTGNIELETIVSHGCRPVGRSYVITKAEGNIVWELGGRQALDVLREAIVRLTPSDQELAQRSILVGLVINEMKAKFQAGDFLLRHLVGIDPPSGAIAIAEHVDVGQTIQFHLRDPWTSQQEFRRRLAERKVRFQTMPPAGALLFDCMGRGKSFYGSSNRDTMAIRTFNEGMPLGGFFCGGEIGPIDGTNFLHGYTASLALFRPSTVAGTQP